MEALIPDLTNQISQQAPSTPSRPTRGRDRSENRTLASVRILVGNAVSQRLVCTVASKVRGCPARYLYVVQIDKVSILPFVLSAPPGACRNAVYRNYELLVTRNST
jgi:hypothetical protein